MQESTHKLSLREKIGYSMGDAAANFVWRSGFFIPVFYTDTFGLAAAHATILILLVRLSDGITDIMMGSIADRTNTKQGKFRPWILWSTPVLAVFLALIFTTPDFSYTGKLIYAFVIYFCLTLAYTANNVPYGAMMGVMTDNRFRHSPVIADNKLHGIVSIGDVVKKKIEHAEREAEELKQYIAG